MFIAIIPIVALVLGLLLWALATHPLVKDAGRITFAAGMLVTLFVASHYALRIGS